jgi:hypothetical protein
VEERTASASSQALSAARDTDLTQPPWEEGGPGLYAHAASSAKRPHMAAAQDNRAHESAPRGEPRAHRRVDRGMGQNVIATAHPDSYSFSFILFSIFHFLFQSQNSNGILVLNSIFR